MATENTADQIVPEKTETEHPFEFFKLVDPIEGEIVPWPNGWKIPGKQTLGIAIPPREDQIIRVVFCPTSERTIHDTLKDLAIAGQNGYRAVSAYIVTEKERGKKHRILQIIAPPKNDIEASEKQGVPFVHPLEILTEPIMEKLLRRLKVSSYKIIEDHRWLRAILEAREKMAQAAPKSPGLAHLKRELERQSD